MKNKKSILVVGLIALVLVLGVGYAVVSSVSLTISGNASVASQDLNVSFEGTVTPSSSKVTGSATKGSTGASITVKNLVLGETVSATYTIQNEETDIDADITMASITNPKDSFFKVTTDVDDTYKTVDAGKTTTITVYVELIQTPVTAENSSETITIALSATPEKNS